MILNGGSFCVPSRFAAGSMSLAPTLGLRIPEFLSMYQIYVNNHASSSCIQQNVKIEPANCRSLTERICVLLCYNQLRKEV